LVGNPWSCGYGRELTTEWLWVQIPTLYTGWLLAMLAITVENKKKIKVAEWGKPQKNI
jgi:hypothetical protein